MRRPLAASHPVATAALAGAVIGLAAAVLLLRFGDPPGAGMLTRSNAIFAWAALPARSWMGYVLGWTPLRGRTLDILVTLMLNGAVWTVALASLVRALRNSARARRTALVSTVLGTTLAALVWRVGIPQTHPGSGLQQTVFAFQIPGLMLLALNGYSPPFFFDGGEVQVGPETWDYHLGPVTFGLLAIANTLLAALQLAGIAAARDLARVRRHTRPAALPVEAG